MNKKYRFFTAIILAVMLTTIILPATASAQLPRFIDEVGLLTSEQARTLTQKLDEVSERHQFDTVVAVVPSIGNQEAEFYAADFFEQNGFGFGPDIDGAIFLIAVEYRDYGFASFGSGIVAFTIVGQDYLDKLVLPHLREDNYYEAFIAYADGVDDFLNKAESGVPYDEGNIPKTASEIRQYRMYGGLFSLLLALIIAWVVTFSWKRQLISVRKENYANVYFREGSMVLNRQHDVFLHSNINRVRRVENTNKSGGGGSFRSSSGRSFTGHSGKY